MEKVFLGTFKSKAVIIYNNQISPLILMKKLESWGSYSNFQNRTEYGPFQMSATVMLNSIDRIKFNFSTAVVQRLKPSRATDV